MTKHTEDVERLVLSSPNVADGREAALRELFPEAFTDSRFDPSSRAEFDRLSCVADTLTGKSNNGWEFWRVERASGPRELARIRGDALAEAEPDRADST